MNESIFREIYKSDCGPIDKMNFTEEYDRLMGETSVYYDKLCEILGDEQKKRLDELLFRESGLEAEWGFMCFRAGIDFGLRFLAELKEGLYKTKNNPPD